MKKKNAYLRFEGLKNVENIVPNCLQHCARRMHPDSDWGCSVHFISTKISAARMYVRKSTESEERDTILPYVGQLPWLGKRLGTRKHPVAPNFRPAHQLFQCVQDEGHT